MATTPGPVASVLPKGLGPLSRQEAPTASPSRAGADLEGKALPTNQWWSGLLTGEDPEPVWSMPIATKVTDDGVAVASPDLFVEDDVMLSPFEPSFFFGGPVSDFSVADFGAFDVTLDIDADPGSFSASLVQGWPAFQATVGEGRWPIRWSGDPLVTELKDDVVRVDIGGKQWHVVVSRGSIESEGSAVVVNSTSASVTFVPTPSGAENDTSWAELAEEIGGSVVSGTTASYTTSLADGHVTQRLRWEGATAIALLPHHTLNTVDAVETSYTYPTSRGPLTVVRASSVDLQVAYRGLIPGVPDTATDGATVEDTLPSIEKVRASLADVEPKPTLTAGSYFGSKELGRLATAVELADAVDVDRPDLLQTLRAGVVDRLTYTGPADPFWLGYDQTWGGVVAMPAEFGSHDYNDHHFHYGYLIQAAVTLAERDPAFVADYGELVGYLIADVLGDSERGLPPFRVFNPYLGHSYASGFVPFVDGNNQESSSESIHAWWAISRWGQLVDDADLAEKAIFLYTLEAEAARLYWLGDERNPRPDGYNHHVAGIVWDAKIDFGTWFDSDPGSIVGIQLLPFSFGSLYRRSPESARRRYADASGENSAPAVWPDLMALDLAIADPAKATQVFEDGGSVEDGNTEAFVWYWLDLLQKLGRPSDKIWPDEPNGMAFESSEGVTLVVNNPTARSLNVTFYDESGRSERLVVGPGEQKTAVSTEWSGE